MKKIIVYHYDAFSSYKNMGNPAGIILNAEALSEEEMLKIAKLIGFNETVFVLNSTIADLKIKYFTPGHEMDLCGHGTIASLYYLHSKGLLPNKKNLKIETKAGVLSVEILETNESTLITMEQNSPSFVSFEGDTTKLASVLGIDISDIDCDLPIIYASTGIWTLLVPIKSLETFSKMKPKTSMFPDVLVQMPRCSIHPFCLETIQSTRDIHSRHFSSAFSGTIEDSVTGTASGAIGGYYAKYISPHEKSFELTMEQGQEVNRDGEVFVYVNNENEKINIKISGTAVYVKEIQLDL